MLVAILPVKGRCMVPESSLSMHMQIAFCCAAKAVYPEANTASLHCRAAFELRHGFGLDVLDHTEELYC